MSRPLSIIALATAVLLPGCGSMPYGSYEPYYGYSYNPYYYPYGYGYLPYGYYYGMPHHHHYSPGFHGGWRFGGGFHGRR